MSIIWAAIILAALVASSTWAAEFWVAPNGNDHNAGTKDAPFATLAKAVEAARTVPPGEPRRIILRGGNYYDVAITLGPEDSGLTLQAADGEQPVLYGGRLLTGWHRDGEHFYAAEVPEVKDRKWDFRMLCVNGRFCPRARLPREGTFTHLTEFNVPWMGTTGGGWQRKPTEEELTTMQYDPQDLGPWLDINNAELTIYHSWDESVVGLAAMDTDRHILKFSTPCGHPPGGFGIRKYVVWNVREGMTDPGQWYLDRTAGKLVYWPLAGEDMATAEVIAPTTTVIIRIRGSQENGVKNITIRGLTLSVTTTPLVAGGFGASRFEGAVNLWNADNCVLERLTISNVGGQGISAYKFSGLRIERCEVFNTGACGIKATGGSCIICDNHVHHVGLTYPSAIALWSGGQNGACTIVHNEVHDAPYTGIACGGDDHVIEGNRIYRVMQVMRDGAGIYVTFGKRMTVRGNFVSDVLFDGNNLAQAYYLDEQAEDCVVEGNLSLRAGAPLLSHWNKNNALRNNIFVFDGDMLLRFPKSSGWQLEKNVIVATGSVLFRDFQAVAEFRDNVVYSRAGKIDVAVRDESGKYTQRPLEPTAGSLLADPLLLEYERGTVRFASDSPALKLGIQPIDVSGAGRRH